MSSPCVCPIATGHMRLFILICWASLGLESSKLEFDLWQGVYFCNFISEILGFFLCKTGMVMTVKPITQTLLSVTVKMDSGFSVKFHLFKLIYLYCYWPSYPQRSLKIIFSCLTCLVGSLYYILLKTVLLSIMDKKCLFPSERSQIIFT